MRKHQPVWTEEERRLVGNQPCRLFRGKLCELGEAKTREDDVGNERILNNQFVEEATCIY